MGKPSAESAARASVAAAVVVGAAMLLGVAVFGGLEVHRMGDDVGEMTAKMAVLDATSSSGDPAGGTDGRNGAESGEVDENAVNARIDGIVAAVAELDDDVRALAAARGGDLAAYLTAEMAAMGIGPADGEPILAPLDAAIDVAQGTADAAKGATDALEDVVRSGGVQSAIDSALAGLNSGFVRGRYRPVPIAAAGRTASSSEHDWLWSLEGARLLVSGHVRVTYSGPVPPSDVVDVPMPQEAADFVAALGITTLSSSTCNGEAFAEEGDSFGNRGEVGAALVSGNPVLRFDLRSADSLATKTYDFSVMCVLTYVNES